MFTFGLMTTKAHREAMAAKDATIAARDDTIFRREAMIGDLQRENVRLSGISGAEKDEGADYVLQSLANALGLERWEQKDGSEEWEGDVWATMFGILTDAGVVEEDYHKVATWAEIEALRPDAEKHRARLIRDREHAASKRAKVGEGVANV